jgi:hypothetical protein
MKECPVPAKKKTERQTAKAAAFTISAPNPFYEGRFYDGKMRFIDGKARITDSLARTVKMRDGVSHGEYFFEDAEEMARHFMDTIGGNLDEQGQPTERSFKITPALAQLAPVIDENTPNAGRPRRDRKRPGGVVRNMEVMPEAQPAGIPAGADPAQVMGVGRKDRKRAVA